MEKQRTIKKEKSLKGIGLHTGNKVSLTFRPAPVNSGINFVRTDLAGHPQISADIHNLLLLDESARRTSVGSNGIEIHTVEHLLACLAGLGIDNLYILIDSNEVPGLDGSAKEFMEALWEAGIEEQDKEKKFFSLREPVSIEEEDSNLIALPSSNFRISYTLNYNHPLLKAQYLDLVITPDVFKKEIATARTFCLEREIDNLLFLGLGRGANYENTVVLGEKDVVKNKLRFEDEFVRHKILDLIGDLSLLGFSVNMHIIALKSGHQENVKLLRKIYQQKQRYEASGIKAVYSSSEGEELDREAIKKILPHRDPFLFVDRIISLEKGKRVVGVKNVQDNEWFFPGHFPQRPVMPGVLIIECMAQVGGVLMLASPENRGKLAYFLSCDNVKFRKTVLPGDQLILEVEAVKLKSKTGLVRGKAYVEGRLVAEADLVFSLAEA